MKVDTLSKLDDMDGGDPVDHPFGPYQEEAIISLALDHPQFFTSVGRFLTPNMFARLECQWVMAEILNAFDKYNAMPTREILYDEIAGKLTADDQYETVLGLVKRKSNHREVPLVKDTLLKWAKNRSYGMIYSEEAMEAFRTGDYALIEKIITDANRIADVGDNGFWFFEHLELLFQPDAVEHRTTGFKQLDKYINNGGPSPKEVFCWLAGTNVGKCHSVYSIVYEERLSRIYELELEDGTIIKLRGSREVQTARGIVKVADLTDRDDITDVPIGDDPWDLEL